MKMINKLIKKGNFFSKSDLQLIHLLSQRGLSFTDTFDLLIKERDMKHSNKNMVSILEKFSKVSGMNREDIRSSRKRNESWVRNVFCYYIRENTGLSNLIIGDYLNMNRSSCSHAERKIREQIESGYKPTIKFLDQIKQEMQS